MKRLKCKDFVIFRLTKIINGDFSEKRDYAKRYIKQYISFFSEISQKTHKQMFKKYIDFWKEASIAELMHDHDIYISYTTPYEYFFIPKDDQKSMDIIKNTCDTYGIHYKIVKKASLPVHKSLMHDEREHIKENYADHIETYQNTQ